MFKAFYVMFIVFFFYSGDYDEHILNLHLLYKQIETYIHKDWDMSRLCQLCVSSIGTLVKGWVCDMFYLLQSY